MYLSIETILNFMKKVNEIIVNTAYQTLNRLYVYKSVIQNIKDNIKSLKTPLENFTKTFAEYKDLIGSYRALSHLTNTYRLDWFKLANLPQSVVTIEDINNMAIIAFESKYFDTCVDFLRAAYKLVPFREREYNAIKDKMDGHKKAVIRIHNQLVTKRKSRVGETHKGREN